MQLEWKLILQEVPGKKVSKINKSKSKISTKNQLPQSKILKQVQLQYLDQLSFSILLEKNLMNMRKQLKRLDDNYTFDILNIRLDKYIDDLQFIHVMNKQMSKKK